MVRFGYCDNFFWMFVETILENQSQLVPHLWHQCIVNQKLFPYVIPRNYCSVFFHHLLYVIQNDNCANTWIGYVVSVNILVSFSLRCANVFYILFIGNISLSPNLLNNVTPTPFICTYVIQNKNMKNTYTWYVLNQQFYVDLSSIQGIESDFVLHRYWSLV